MKIEIIVCIFINMERLIERNLEEWRESSARKPLVLLGIRQCGKTYTLKEFGSKHYRNVAYVDFEKRTDLHRLFWNLDPERIVDELSRELRTPIDEDTLIIFDEVQMCYPALTSLKYFLQDAPQYHIACAGSLLGLVLADRWDEEDNEKERDREQDGDGERPRHSFPVGKVSFLRMRPLCFGEYVLARLGRRTFDYIDRLSPYDELPEGLMESLESAFIEYLQVGGMPESVDTWCRTGSMTEVRRVQSEISASYERDMGKYSGESYSAITAIWRSAAHQVAEGGNRFKLKDVGKSLKTASDRISWLINADMLVRAWEVNDDRVPPNPRGGIYFKLYYPDVGLLTNETGVDHAILSSKDESTSKIRGAIAENFVLNELRYALDIDDDAYYWANEKGKAEVDFQLTLGHHPVPVEVKFGNVSRMQGLDFYCSRYRPEAAFVLSKRNVRIGDRKTYTFVPLYMAWKFGMYAEAAGIRMSPTEPPPLKKWEPPTD